MLFNEALKKKINKIGRRKQNAYFNKTNELHGNFPSYGNGRNVLKRHAMFKCAVAHAVHVNLSKSGTFI